MLADVELDWSLPSGYGVRAMTQEDGTTSDLMVCIPLPGDGRYRVSSFVAPDLATTAEAGAVTHGLEGKHPPTLGTSRPWWTDSLRNRPRLETCSGRRCSGSATASPAATEPSACSSPAMPHTFIHPPARRA